MLYISAGALFEADEAPLLMDIAVWSLVWHLGSVVAVTAIIITRTVVSGWTHRDGVVEELGIISDRLLAI